MEDSKTRVSTEDQLLLFCNPLSSILYPRLSSRRGFSFAEVMFAVVILGIGFIMVAAVFPVAIQQTQATGEENIAALAARDAADSIVSVPSMSKNPAYIANASPAQITANPAVAIATYPVFPPTVKNYVVGTNPASTPPPAIVVPFNGARWKLIQSDSIMVSDTRYAYVPFYRRENGSAAAELIVISVAVRNKPTYITLNDALNTQNTATISTTSGFSSAPSQGTLTTIYPDAISVSNPSGTPAPGEGTAVLAPTATPGVYAGRSYTMGRSVGTSQWEINPGDSLALTAGTNGNWGTLGATTDLALNGATAGYNTAATLQPQVAYANLVATPSNPAGQITLGTDPVNMTAPLNAAPGAFVIIADDYPYDPSAATTASYAVPANYNTAGATYQVGALNGRIFRLGALVGASPYGGTTFNLDPSYGMRPASGGGDSPDSIPSTELAAAAAASGLTASYYTQQFFHAKVYIVGQGQLTGALPTGGSQDIGVFATYFPVK